MKGFTLIEMMVTVAVSSILLSAAVPSYQQIIMRNEVASMSLEFNSALRLAQSESIRRDRKVTLVPHTSSGKTWLGGWNIFVDESNIGVQNSTEELLKSYTFHNDKTTLTSSNSIFSTYITFLPNGTISGKSGYSGSFKVCPSNANKDISRTIELVRSGYVRSSKKTKYCP